MKFSSTRGGGAVTLDEALLAGIAADGGLFMPRELPQFDVDDFPADGGIHGTATCSCAPTSTVATAPWRRP